LFRSSDKYTDTAFSPLENLVGGIWHQPDNEYHRLCTTAVSGLVATSTLNTSLLEEALHLDNRPGGADRS
jgi:hypothetical protein